MILRSFTVIMFFLILCWQWFFFVVFFGGEVELLNLLVLIEVVEGHTKPQVETICRVPYENVCFDMLSLSTHPSRTSVAYT